MPAIDSLDVGTIAQPSVRDVSPVAPVQHPCQQVPAPTSSPFFSLPPGFEGLRWEYKLLYWRTVEGQRQRQGSGLAEVHLDPLLIRAHSEYNVNLWLLTLAATLATRPVLPHTSALDATARDDIPMAIARGMQRVPWSLEPINEREIGRALYDEEQEVADLCQSEDGRRFWAYLRMQPDRVPEFDPGQWPPGFSRFLPDTQRAWDQIDKCDDLESAHQDRRMQEVLWRRQQQPPAAPASTKPLTGDLARDQGTDSENSMTDKQQEQPQQPEQASGEADSVAGQEQPPTPTQPTKPAKKASLCDRFVCAMERKAGKWKAKAGKAVDFVQAMVGEAVDFITSI